MEYNEEIAQLQDTDDNVGLFTVIIGLCDHQSKSKLIRKSHKDIQSHQYLTIAMF